MNQHRTQTSNMTTIYIYSVAHIYLVPTCTNSYAFKLIN